MNSCILFTPATAYLRGVCEVYAQALAAQGYEVKNLSIYNNPNISGDIWNSVDDSFRFFLSFEGDGVNIGTAESSLYALIKRPLVSLCAAELPFITHETPWIIRGLRDRLEVHGSSFFAPFPGMIDENGEPPERDVDVLFAYDIKPPDTARGQFRLDPNLAQVCEDMLEILLANERTTAGQAFDTVMESRGIYLHNWAEISDTTMRGLTAANAPEDGLYPPERRDFRSVCIRLVNAFMRNHRRARLLETLRHAGVPVTVFPQQGFRERLAMLRRSKIVVCADTALTYALPERMVCGMTAAAVVASDTNAFIEETFTARDYISYRHNDYGLLADKIKEALNSPSERMAIAENGRQVIRGAYSPAHAAQKIIQTAELSRLFYA